MPRPVAQLFRSTFSGPNLRATVVLLTSSICLSAWSALGHYSFWFELGDASGDRILPAIESIASTFILLGVVPALVVNFLLREKLSTYGLRLGDWKFSLKAIVLTIPLMILIGYLSAQRQEYQAAYPINPPALASATALTLHLLGQFFFYAGWEFHFRGFLQNGLKRRTGATTAICIQTMASTLAHFGKPTSEVFGAIIGGLLWGALAWRTRSLLASYCQHWLLGASLDFFIFRGSSR
jgi:membrane protease YdiL (CAAX protease family)